ncbi:hypothetical protein [Solidesulfovibrio sp.]|uniref:hypothetical protein n=1 Tax=Solidesulfovibrio sp. TaxID=2910990 RepID=UPI00260EDAC2|nr:hypothetical protein [Solidesulfovibrio sp.]
MTNYIQFLISTKLRLYVALTGWLTIWFFFTLWRINYLGFYSDDWIFLSKTIISPHSINDYIATNNYARPVYGLITWILNEISDGNPLKWQIISSVISFIYSSTALIVFVIVLNKIGFNKNPSFIGALIGAIILAFSPWSLAVLVWPTGVLTLWGFILFGIGYIIIENTNAKTKLYGSLLVLCGCLAYEAYWFIFIPLLLMSHKFNYKGIINLLKNSLWYIVPVFLGILYQRLYVPFCITNNPRHISLNPSLIINNICDLDRFVAQSITPTSWSLFSKSILYIFLYLLLLRHLQIQKAIKIIFSLLIGMLISAIMYGLAGYGLTGTGVMSRTMAVPGLYFAIFVSAMIAAACKKVNNKLLHYSHMIISTMLFLTVFSIIATGFYLRISEWATIQQKSKKVLESVATSLTKYPHVPTQNADDRHIVIVQIDGDQDGNIFGASWELSGAMALMSPELFTFNDIWLLTARQGAWATQWDGNDVVQSVCTNSDGNVVEKRHTSQQPLYIRVDEQQGLVIQQCVIVQNTQFGCNNIPPSCSNLN